MDSIADAIVYATAYIGCREETEESDDDAVFEHIMAYLSNATAEEEDALAAAAERALAEEKSLQHPRQEMISFFEKWMQIVSRWDWEGNRRV